MTTRRLAALTGLLGVALGAFGAHGISATIEAVEGGADWWRTATLYHLVHAVAILASGAGGRPARAGAAAWCFAAGVVLFSGTLYAMAVGAPRSLNPRRIRMAPSIQGPQMRSAPLVASDSVTPCAGSTAVWLM